MMEDSVFDEGVSSDFAPPAKPAKAVKVTKPKAAAPKKAAAPAKPKGRPAKDPAAAAKPKPKAKAAPKKKAKDDSGDENSDIDMDKASLHDDDSLLADTPPKQKKAAPAPKKSSGQPLADIANESFGMDGAGDAPAPKPKKAAGGASDKYQMVSSQRNVEVTVANACAVVTFGAYHEASRHIHWLCRAAVE